MLARLAPILLAAGLAVGLAAQPAAPVSLAPVERLWAEQDYPAAARLVEAAGPNPADPVLALYRAKLDYARGRASQAERRAVAVAARFPVGDSRRLEALDVAARSSFLRGDYPAAARHARESCRAVGPSTPPSTTADGIDPLCVRVRSAVLEFLGDARPGPAALEPGHTVPMSPRRPTVAGRVNGREAPVLVDTGAESSFVLERDAVRFGLRRTGVKAEIVGFTEDRVAVEWAVADTLEIAGWRLRAVPVLVLPNVFPPGAIPPFVVGLPELWPFRATFDYPGASLTLAPTAGPSGGPAREALLVGPALRAPVSTLGATVYATLDTGSDRLLLSRERLTAAGATLGPSAGPSQSVVGVSGSLALEPLLLQRVGLLGRAYDLVPAALAERLPEGAGGIFGYELVKDLRLVVDLQAEGIALVGP